MSTATIDLPRSYVIPIAADLDRVRTKYTVALWAHTKRNDTAYALGLIREADGYLPGIIRRVESVRDGDPVNHRESLLETVEMLRDIRRTFLAFAG